MRGEAAKLQGTWDIVTLEIDGSPMAEGMIRGAQIVVEGERFTTVAMGAAYGGRIELTSSKKPKEMDLIFEEGPEKGNRSLGIYEIDGDRWTLCLTVTGRTRPKRFATAPGSGHALETLKRREGTRAVMPRDELRRLEGEWTLVHGEADGRPFPEEALAIGKRVVRGNEITVTMGPEVYLQAAFALRPSETPKAIDYVITAGPHQAQTQLGIYETDGDRIKVCMAPVGRPRPRGFSTRPPEGGVLTVWKRKGAR